MSKSSGISRRRERNTCTKNSIWIKTRNSSSRRRNSSRQRRIRHRRWSSRRNRDRSKKGRRSKDSRNRVAGSSSMEPVDSGTCIDWHFIEVDLESIACRQCQ